MPAPCILSSRNARNTYLTGPLRTGARRGRGKPRSVLKTSELQSGSGFPQYLHQQGTRGWNANSQAFGRLCWINIPGMESSSVLASLTSKVMGQVEFANQIPISPGRMFSPHNWVTACPYAIYLVNTQRLLILHSKGSFGNYFGKQARMFKLCFTCILCSFSWLLWECGLFQIKPMILVYKAWGLYGRAYLWETFAS